MDTSLGDLETRLRRIVRSTPWLMRALRAVRDAGIPEGYVCSGAIRNATWDALHGYSTPSFLADVDVGYFDPNDLSEKAEKEHGAETYRARIGGYVACVE